MSRLNTGQCRVRWQGARPKQADFEIIQPAWEALTDVSRMREQASADAHAESHVGGASKEGRRTTPQGRRPSILMEDLDMMMTLGTARRVVRCEHQTTGRMMALKAMMKTQIKVSPEKNVVAERHL